MISQLNTISARNVVCMQVAMTMLQAHRMAMRSSSVAALRSNKSAGLRRALHTKDYKVMAKVEA
jgi:hypothetical protein